MVSIFGLLNVKAYLHSNLLIFNELNLVNPLKSYLFGKNNS